MLARPLTQPLTGPLVRGVGEGGGLSRNVFLDSSWQTSNLATSTFTEVAPDAGNFLSDGTSGTCAYKRIDAVPGDTYTLTCNLFRVGSVATLYRVGETIGGSQYVTRSPSNSTPAPVTNTFVPNVTPIYVAIGLGGAGAEIHTSDIRLRRTGIGVAIAAWGDSLTAGTGASVSANNYVGVSRTLFTSTRVVVNYGVGGDTSAQIATRQAASTATRTLTHWLWAGRNDTPDFSSAKANIDAMIATLPHSRFLVASILPSAADLASSITAISAINATLSSAYGAKFVDLITTLQAANDGSANDLADIAAGYIPRSLRFDSVHLNDAGYSIVAHKMHDAHVAAGYP